MDSPATSVPEKSGFPPLEALSKKKRTRRRSKQPAPREPLAQTKHYWNEFDDGEEASGAEVYTLLVDPNATTPFIDGLSALKAKGVKTLQHIRTKLSSKTSKGGEREPLLPTDYFSIPPTGGSAESSGGSDTSNSTRQRPRLPNRYSAFPSYHSISSPLDPLSTHTLEKRDTNLSWYMILAFLVALVLLLTSGLAQITWRQGTFIAVDIAVVFGIVASLTCTVAGLGSGMARQEDVGWMGRAQVFLMFAVLCVGNGVLVVHLVLG